MKAFVITLEGNEYSQEKAKRCIETGLRVGEVEVAHFRAVNKDDAESVMKSFGLAWTWAKQNTEVTYCPITNLRQHPYGKKQASLLTKIGCSMSHYLLWNMSVELDEPILILEHDSVFIRKLPNFDFKGICQINDPMGATRKGQWWHDHMIKRGTSGVHEKTWVTSTNERQIPDGLAGNSAYVIKPWAARELITKYHELGVWPNDATMCKQLFPYLEEYYPFITRVEQTISTSI